MQDMIPKGTRSIRNIPMPSGNRRVPIQRPAPVEQQEERYDDEEDFGEPILPRKRNKYMNRNWFFWAAIVVIVVCAVGGILLSTLFAGATVSVTPHSATVAVPATMLAQVNAPAGTLAYQVVSISRTASTTVKATGSAQVSKSASGVVTIYNAYSASPQPLIAKTRFEAPNGNIYRIKDAVTVPGAKASPDGNLTPGTVSATVYADAAGSTYNLTNQTQFTIPGFKGDPRFTKFYAQTSSISGGFVGQQATVAPADLTSAENALKQGLQGALQDAATTQIPKDFLTVGGTLSMSYSDITQTAADGGMVGLSETATASADIVRIADLAAAIAKQKVDNYKGEAVNFVDPSAVTVALASGSTPGQGMLQLALSGSPTLVWQFDPNALKAALVGKPKGTFEQIVTSFAPAITCSPTTPCSASIRPFWSGTFPKDAAKITVVTK